MTRVDLPNALECLAKRGRLLREQLRLDWSPQAEQAVEAMLFLPGRGSRRKEDRPTLVAIVGGASSGKSTVFNNLLGGRLASRVTAKGHATRGPIAAVHELRRDAVEQALQAGLLMPSFVHRAVGLDDNTTGDPDSLPIVYHDVDRLRDVVLFDTPDLTSEMARLEGDIVLATLPWFDRLVVLVDHERWFDRQTIGRLRNESAQFGQERLAVFNRSKDGPLPEAERTRLKEQARRLEAVDHLVLEFRRGRGCCTFPPGTFDPVLDWLHRPGPPRDRPLVHFLGRLATVVLNNNTQRRARLARLRDALDRAAAGPVPSRTECFTALMTSAERRHLEVISRTLRITETSEWLTRQAARIRHTLRERVPVFGRLLAAEPEARGSPETADRHLIGWEVFQSRCRRQLGAIDDAAAGSEFWAEVQRWTPLKAPGQGPEKSHAGTPRASSGTLEETIDQQCDAVQSVVAKINAAIEAWTAKVQSECAGASPRLTGAIGAASVAGAIVLVAISGPVGALTWPAITAALGGALGTLAASAGAGAIGGPALGRLLAVVREKLLGSAEFRAVQTATEDYRELVATFGRQAANRAFADAAALVLPEDDDLTAALTVLCDAAEIE